MAMPFRQRPEFLRGRDGEQKVARWLQSRKWYIIPSYDYSGPDGEVAPKLRGQQDGIVLPDLGLAKAGLLKWAEVKSKWAPTFTLLTHTYDHGIGYRNWCHYKRFQDETGCHVFLFILEEVSQTLLVERLDNLGKGRHYFGDEMDHGGMVFWTRDSFSQKYALDAIPGLLDSDADLPFEIG
jgi:hypothetical protein